MQRSKTIIKFNSIQITWNVGRFVIRAIFKAWIGIEIAFITELLRLLKFVRIPQPAHCTTPMNIVCNVLKSMNSVQFLITENIAHILARSLIVAVFPEFSCPFSMQPICILIACAIAK